MNKLEFIWREILRLEEALRTFKRPHESGCHGQGVEGHCTCGALDHNERIEKLINGGE